MGLSSWIQKLLAKSQSPAKKSRNAGEDFVQLFLTRLEDRRVLNADFELVAGNTLLLDNFTETAGNAENLTIQQNVGGDYEFILAEGTWTQIGAGDPGITADGAGTLTVDGDLINANDVINTLQIDDGTDGNIEISFGPGTTDLSNLDVGTDITGMGDVTQNGASVLLVSTLNVGPATNSVTLNNANNDFGTATINVTAGAAIRDVNDLTLGAVTTGDDFTATVGAANTLTLTGDINTDGTTATNDAPVVSAGLVNITGDVVLGNDVTIDTDADTADGSVTITGTVNSDGTPRDLVIESGDANTTITADIGAELNGALDQLSINNDDRNGTFGNDGQRGTGTGTGTIEIANIGTTTAVGASEVFLGNKAETLALNFKGTEYRTTVSHDTFADTMNLDSNADLNITSGSRIILHGNLEGDLSGSSESDIVLTTGTVRLFGFGTITGIRSLDVNTSASATITSDITTSDSNPGGIANFVRFQSSVAMSGVMIDTSAGNGTITFLGNNVQAGGTDLTFNAGTGTITATQLGVNNNQVNDLTITAGTFNLSGGILTRDQGGSGDILITVSTAFNITGTVTIDTTDPSGDGNGIVDGTLTVNGLINADSQVLDIRVGTQDLTLTNANNDFGTLLITAQNASIVDVDDIQLGASTIGNDLSITALAGGITNAATPGIITVGNDLTLSAVGDIGSSSSPLAVRVGTVIATGTASLTATGSDIFMTSDMDLTIDELETAAGADMVQISTTGAASLTIQVVTADFVNLATDDVDFSTEQGLLTIQGDELAVATLDLVNSDAAGRTSVTSTISTTGGFSVNTLNTTTPSSISGQITGSGGLTKDGAGTLILNNTGTANDFTGNITINGGILRTDAADQLPEPAIVFIAFGAVLALNNNNETIAQLSGNGTVEVGTATLNLGIFSPGDGDAGILTINDLILGAGSNYIVDFDTPYATAGVDFDQANVIGTVTLNNPTLTLQPGTTAPPAGTSIVIIQNDGVDPLMGAGTFNGLAQGAVVTTVGGLDFVINYLGGDGNDVALEVAGPLNYTSPGGNITVRRNEQGAGTADDLIEILEGTTVVESRLASNVDAINITGADGINDILTVDYFFGGFFTTPIDFDGGSTGNDALVVTDNNTINFDRAVHTFSSAGPGLAGDIVYTEGGDVATITYSNLEPVDMTGTTVADLVFNLPGMDDRAFLEDDGISGNGISQIRSDNPAPTFDLTTFMNPTGSLTINLGADAATFTISDPTNGLPDLTSTLIIADAVADGETDTVIFDGEVDLDASTLGNLMVTADVIQFTANADVDTTLGTTGSVTLTADQNIEMVEGSMLNSGGPVVMTSTTGSVLLSRVVATNNPVNITAGDAIIDNTAAEGAGNENIVTGTGTITLTAENGIGNGTGVLGPDPLGEVEDIDISGGTLTATNNTAGAIQIFDTGSLELNLVENQAATGAVVLRAATTIVDNRAGEGLGSENIIADTIRLQATNGIGFGTGLFDEMQDIDINGNTLQAVNTLANAIQIFEVDDIAVEVVDNAARRVVLEALGAITDGTPSPTEGANFIAGLLGLRAGTGIGSGLKNQDTDIDTNVATIAAETTTGTINIDETNALTIGTVGSAIAGNEVIGITNVPGPAAGVDDLIVIAGGNLTVDQVVTNNDGGDIDLEATASLLQVNANVTVPIQAVGLIPDGSILMTGNEVVIGTGITVSTVGDGNQITQTTPRSGLVTGEGTITIVGTTRVELADNAVVDTEGGVIQIETNNIIIASNARIESDAANNGVVMIRNATPITITLGGVDPLTYLNNTELQTIRAESLRIGRREIADTTNNTQNISIVNPFTAGQVDTIQLFAQGNVTQTATGNIVVNNLGIDVGGFVRLNNAPPNALNNVTTIAILAVGSVEYTDGNNLIIGAISDKVDDALPIAPDTTPDGENGISGVTSGSFVEIRTVNGNLTVLDLLNDATEVEAGGTNPINKLAINMEAGGAGNTLILNEDTIAGTRSNVESTIGPHRYTADNMTIDGTIMAGTFSVNLRTFTNGRAIDLGSQSAGRLSLEDGELDLITTSLLVIGRNDNGIASGDILSTAAVNPMNTNTLQLITGARVLDDTNGAIVVGNLMIEAAGDVILDNTGLHDVDVLAALITRLPTALVTDPGSEFTFTDLDDIAVGSVARSTIDALQCVIVVTFNGINTDGGDVTLTSETGGVEVDQMIETTAEADGRDSGSIEIEALDVGTININAPLITTGTPTGTNGEGGDVMLTTTNGDIVLRSDTPPVPSPQVLTIGSINAIGGGNGAVDGGIITLDANGVDADVILDAAANTIMTNDIADGTVRGSITINADDAVMINANISTTTAVATTGLGTVTITANTDGAAGNNGGNITMGAGTTITAQNGNQNAVQNGDVILRTLAGDEGDIFVENIITNEAKVFVDANGEDASITLRGNITTNSPPPTDVATSNGEVELRADDSVMFLVTASIETNPNALIGGNVLIQANDNNLVGSDGNQINMADGSFINAGIGTITLTTHSPAAPNPFTGRGGNVTISQLVTNNTTNDAVRIQSDMSVLDGGDSNAAGTTLGKDIEATALGSEISILAVTGIGTELNPLDTSGIRFDINNTGATDPNGMGAAITPTTTFVVAIQNMTAANVPVETVRLFGASMRTIADPGVAGSQVRFQNMGGGELTISNGGQAANIPGASSGNQAGGVEGGLIKIVNDGRILVNSRLTSALGTGGALIVNGGVTFNGDTSVRLGQGNIELNSGNGTGNDDLFIESDLIIDGGPARFYAAGDIIVGATLLTRVEDGVTPGNFVDATLVGVPILTITADIVLSADNPQGEMFMTSITDPNLVMATGDGMGGVLIQDNNDIAIGPTERTDGQVIASGNLLIEGSDLINDQLLVNNGTPNELSTSALGPIQNGVHIERDLSPSEQFQIRVAVNGNRIAPPPAIPNTPTAAITIRNRPSTLPGNDTADIVLGGIIGTLNPNAGDIFTSGVLLDVLIDANQNIHIGDDTRVSSGTNITFGDSTDRDPVIDDGVADTTSNLTVNSSLVSTFFGRVGDAPFDLDNPAFTPTPISERITSLATSMEGETHIRGGFVSTTANQTFADMVLLNADTSLVNSTMFTAGGDVDFARQVLGLIQVRDPADPNDPNAAPVLFAEVLDDLILNVTGTTTFRNVVGNPPTNTTPETTLPPTDPSPKAMNTQRIGDGMGDAIRILSTGTTEFQGQVNTESGIRQVETAGRITFRENLDLLFVDAANSTDSFFLADVTLDGLTVFSDGNLNFGSTVANTDELLIFFDSTLDTKREGKNITINSRVADPDSSNQDLTFNLSANNMDGGGNTLAGDLMIVGSVGVFDDSLPESQVTNFSPTHNPFGDILIIAANNVLLVPVGENLSVFAETLTQHTGINTDTLALTNISGTVQTLNANGVTLATSNVLFNSDINTHGGRVLTEAANNITYSLASSTTTLGGMVVSDAGEFLTMEENSMAGFSPLVATIDASTAAPGIGGTVVLEATNNLTFSQIRSIGGYVSLKSLTGAIVDGGDLNGFAAGDPIGANDVQSAQLRIQAETGVGIDGDNPDTMTQIESMVLETMVSNLEILNNTNGILIFNTGGLTIGGVDAMTVATLRQDVGTTTPQINAIGNPLLNGVSTNTGDIVITTASPMTVIEDIVQNATGGTTGNITLTAIGTDGDFTVNQTVEVTDTNNITNIQANNGNVTIAAGNNFTSNDGTGPGPGNVGISSSNGNVMIGTGMDFTTNDMTMILANDSPGNMGSQGNIMIMTGNNLLADDNTMIIANGGAVGLATDNMTNGNVTIITGNNFATTTMTMMMAMNGTFQSTIGGDATFGGHVNATNSGNILVDVNGNFTLQNGMMENDLQVEGVDLNANGRIDPEEPNGRIVVTADGNDGNGPPVNSINFNSGSGARVTSGTGSILQAVPQVVLQPPEQIEIGGLATLVFTVGILGESNFSVMVDWGDGEFSLTTGVPGGIEQQITHTFTAPPDATNPGADVRVFMVMVTDPNIHFIGNNNSNFLPADNRPLQPLPDIPLPNANPVIPGIGTFFEPFFVDPITGTSLTVPQFIDRALNPINPNNPQLGFSVDIDMDNLSVVNFVPIFPVPISGFGAVEVEDIEELPPFFVPGGSVSFLPDDTNETDDESDDLEFSGSDAEDKGEGEIKVRLRVLSLFGRKLYEYEIESKYLTNPAPLWQRLDDGRYQIIIIEPGRSIPTVVRDVQLKQHKVIRQFDRSRRDISSPSTTQPENQAPVLPISWETAEPQFSDAQTLPSNGEELAPEDPDHVWENWQRPAARHRLSPVTDPEVDADEGTKQGTLSAAAAVLAGSLALEARSSDEADSEMMQFSKRSLSPAARLRRRLKK